MTKLEELTMLLSHKNVDSPYRGWSPEKVQQWEHLRLGYVYKKETEILDTLFVFDEDSVGLDVACGSGRFAKLFNGEYVGLDHSPSMLESAREKGINNLVLGDAFHLPFRRRVFSTTLFFRFIHHFETEKIMEFFREVIQTTKTKGVLIFDLTHRRSIPYFVAKAFGSRLMGSHPGEMDNFFTRLRRIRINAFVLPAISYNFIPPKIAWLIDALFTKLIPARSFWRLEK